MFEQSIFFIKVHILEYSSLRPWQLEKQFYASGSGFCISIEGAKYFVTNSHVINNAHSISIKKHNDSEFVFAKVLYDNPHIDLAFLSCDIDAKPLVIDYKIPNSREEVYLYGFPDGVQNVSVSKGIINRIIMQELLMTNVVAIQIDNASYFGNSGGPLMYKDKVVGILNYGITPGGSINFCIPSYFLKYMHQIYTNNKDPGISSIAFKYQHLNPLYSKKHKYDGRGVIITKVLSPHSTIKPGDILTTFNGVMIDSDGTVMLSSFLDIPKPLDFPVTVKHYAGIYTDNTPIKCTVWRDGKIIDAITEIEYTSLGVEPKNNRFVRADENTLFVPLSFKGAEEMRSKGYNMSLIYMGYYPNKLNIVLVESVETPNITEVRTPAIVKAVNGKKPKTFEDFIKLMKARELNITFRKWHEHLYMEKPKLIIK